MCDYVYDLETENHHFSAGVGEIVVHNTDSVMATMGTKDPMETIKLGKVLEKELSDLFPSENSYRFMISINISQAIKDVFISTFNPFLDNKRFS